MFEGPCRDNLLAIAKAYAKATKLPLATVSRKFYGNQAFLIDFQKGKRSITISKLEEMLKQFAASWPPGVERPKLVPVPMGVEEKKIPVKNPST